MYASAGVRRADLDRARLPHEAVSPEGNSPAKHAAAAVKHAYALTHRYLLDAQDPVMRRLKAPVPVNVQVQHPASSEFRSTASPPPSGSQGAQNRAALRGNGSSAGVIQERLYAAALDKNDGVPAQGGQQRQGKSQQDGKESDQYQQFDSR
jgi:hypothetical protein